MGSELFSRYFPNIACDLDLLWPPVREHKRRLKEIIIYGSNRSTHSKLIIGLQPVLNGRRQVMEYHNIGLTFSMWDYPSLLNSSNVAHWCT